MALNIKNAEVERLAREVAQLSGETKTEAIRKALEERKARLSNKIAVSRLERAELFLAEEVWPLTRGQGAPTKAERESWLGYGDHGV